MQGARRVRSEEGPRTPPGRRPSRASGVTVRFTLRGILGAIINLTGIQAYASNYFSELHLLVLETSPDFVFGNIHVFYEYTPNIIIFEHYSF